MPTFLLSNICASKLFSLHNNFFNALKLILAVCSALAFFSCENYRAGEPIITQHVEITNVNQDTIIAIRNEKLASTAAISFTETLSDTALVRISPDTAFSIHGTLFLLPITNPPLMMISVLSGDSLFIQYQPYNKPISGDLTIEIQYQK